MIENSTLLKRRTGTRSPTGAPPTLGAYILLPAITAVSAHIIEERTMTDSTAGPAPAKAALWEDFVDIFFQPADVFDRRREGKFGIAMLVLSLTGALLYFLFMNALGPINDAEIARAQAMSQSPTPEVGAEQMMEKFAAVLYVFATPFGAFLTGLILWVVGKLFGATQSVATAVMIATYSQFPRLIELATNAVQGILMSPENITSRYSVSLGAGRFFDATTTNPILMNVIGQVDLFTIWVTVLLGIGLYVTAGVTKKSAAIAAGLIWLIGVVPGLFGALVQG